MSGDPASAPLPSLLLFAVAFLIGSIPFGLIVARIMNVKDLRARGSGNIGATNVSRVLGFWPAGAVTLLLDLLKGALPVLIVSLPSFQSAWLGWWRASPGEAGIGLATIWFTALFAVLGHCYSPWLRFNGGKGVATGLGAILVLSPLSALFGVLAFALTFALRRTGSLSSMAGVITVAVAYLVFNPGGPHLLAGALLIFVILLRHESNLDALLENKERTF